MEKDIQRLVSEWIEHDKIVLAVDYDDTIFPWKHNSQEECDEVVKSVLMAQSIGAHIMIHTASHPDRHFEIIKYCKSKGIIPKSINKNPIELPYGNGGKPYYNWQLCDRSGLQYAKAILDMACINVIKEKLKKKK